MNRYRMWWLGLVVGSVFAVPAEARLWTEVLPLARSVQTNTTVTFLATYTNGGDMALSNCQTRLASDIPASLSSLDLEGNPLAPFSLAPSETRELVLAIVPSAPFPSTQVLFNFVCEDPGGESVAAPPIPGVNVIVLTVSDTPTADVVALSTFFGIDGGLEGGFGDVLPLDPSNFIAVSTTNFGVGAQITVVPNTGATQLPLVLSICETDPATGVCINPTTPAPSVTTTVDENETPSFAVTVTSEGTIPPDPNSRIFVPFLDEQGEVRGLTSVAVVSLLQPEQGQALPGTWRDNENEVCFNVSADGNRLTPEDSTCAGGSSLNLDLSSIFNASGFPCDVDVSTDKEVQIVNGTFSFVDITEDGSPLGSFRTAFVYGRFEDSVLLNVGTAATIKNVEGACFGGWLDAQPEALGSSGP